MKVDIDYKFGQSLYIKSDPEQIEYLLNRIILEPKGRLSLELLHPDGSLFEILEMHLSKQKDILKASGVDNSEVDEES